MALLLPLSFVPSSSASHRTLSIPAAANPSLRLQWKSLGLQQKSFNGARVSNQLLYGEKKSVVVHATSETDGTEQSEVAVPVENLPLESKQKMISEQRLKMKLAKKLRLRRKRLVRKRRLRKKGRWPPSKMKKNKNV
ncbi:large ribosomal subunit protein cL37 [Typha angustifolia]|uniref:large ribosomal subunit protein cL37 n=1 Tax=Typha angustifolia TaxID=59011 RepID=UPI003C2CB220